MFRLGLGYPSLLLSQQLKNATAAVFVLYSISIFLCLLCFALFFLILILLIVPALAFLFMVKSIPALSDRFIITVDFADK